MEKFFSTHKFSILLFASCCALYLSFGYDLERGAFVKLVSLYGALFFLTWKFYKINLQQPKVLLAAAVIFRLLFLFSLPNLSQDFYRFIWDGRLLLAGINPYLSIPNDLITSGNLPFQNAADLYNGMGALSAGNPTSYPPLNQIFFALGALFGGKGILGPVIVMRTFIILADIGIYFFGRKLLQQLKMPSRNIFLYFLNPFVIIELTGNLHFEGVMLVFLIAGIYLLKCQKWLFSSIFFAASILLKLIPLLFLPLLLKFLGFKKAIVFYVITGLLVLLAFSPFLSGIFAENFFASISLWFQKFEFNASFYYLIRWIGFQLKGYNIIQFAGPGLAVIIFLAVLGLAFFRRNSSLQVLLVSMLFAISIYLFLSPTVHPWYTATPLLLSVFTPYKFPLVWSLFAILSYAAYSTPDFQENLWLVALEYIVVFGFLGWELFQRQFSEKTPAYFSTDYGDN